MSSKLDAKRAHVHALVRTLKVPSRCPVLKRARRASLAAVLWARLPRPAPPLATPGPAQPPPGHDDADGTLVAQTVDSMDADGSGAIEWDEFRAAVQRAAEPVSTRIYPISGPLPLLAD